MAISERERHLLHQTLDELMDPDVADTLMRHLPPSGWADVATKHDLVELEARLTSRFETLLAREVGGLRREVHTEVGGLRSEVHTEVRGLRSELHTEVGGLASELRTDIDSLASELRADIGSLRDELHTEVGSLRDELHTEVGSLRDELRTGIGSLRSEMHTELHAMARTYLLGNIALVLTVAAIAFGAARLV